jgi:hypothetical protein
MIEHWTWTLNICGFLRSCIWSTQNMLFRPKNFLMQNIILTINNFILIKNSLMLEHWTRLLKIYGRKTKRNFLRFCSFLRILLLLTFFATFLLSKIWNHNTIWLFWHRNWHGCKKFGHVCIFVQTLDWLSLKSKQFFANIYQSPFDSK